MLPSHDANFFQLFGLPLRGGVFFVCHPKWLSHNVVHIKGRPSNNGVNYCHFLIKKTRPGFLVLAATVIAAQRNALGQEALRVGTEGNLAATQALHEREGTALGYYNFLVGPTAWRFSSGMGFQYNDNIYLNKDNPQSSLVLQPSVGSIMHWPVTLNNSLDFSLNAGYSEYLQHSARSQFNVQPGSQLSFDIYVGDCKINLHDRLNITDVGYQNPGVAGSGNNQETLYNTAGLVAAYDFGRLQTHLGYDHSDYIQLNTTTLPSVTSENFYGDAGIPIQPELIAGVESGVSLINYQLTGPFNPFNVSAATQWYAGIFASYQLSDFLSARLDGGHTDYIPDNTVGGFPSASDPGYYFSTTLTHKVNQWLNYTLTAGRSTDLSSAGQVQTRTYVQLNPYYNILEHYSISTPFTYQQGSRPTYITLNSGEDYDQFTIGLTVSRPITKKLTTTLSYLYINEDSTTAGLVYTQNLITLSFNYQF